MTPLKKKIKKKQKKNGCIKINGGKKRTTSSQVKFLKPVP
jgi:hypothetical protein